jgi:hypothetical protein
MSFSIVTTCLCSCIKNKPEARNPANDSCVLAKIVLAAHLNISDNAYKVDFSGNKITRLTSTKYDIKYTYNNAGFLLRKEVFLINTNQLASKIEFKTNTNGQITEISDTVFIAPQGYQTHIRRNELFYSGDKLAECRYFDNRNLYQGKNVYYWSGGNIIYFSKYDQYNRIWDSTGISYNLSMENKIIDESTQFILHDMISGSNTSQTSSIYNFLFASKNLAVSATPVYYVSQASPIKYELNNKGLVTKIYIDETPWWVFNYTCD